MPNKAKHIIATDTPSTLPDYSTHFHKPEGGYFLAHSIGLMPTSTQQHLQQHYLEPWKSASSDTWPFWLNSITTFNQALATLFNSDADLFCPQSNISSGLTKILHSLPKNNGRSTIVASAKDFPSTGFVLQQITRHGYTLKLIPPDADLQCPETWSNILTDEVACVFITHVLYNTNAKTPVADITLQCRKKNIFSILDIAQSAGIVPIDINNLGVDAVVGSSIKWLCGGPGAGFLWLKRERISELNPTDVGWFSHQNPFEFDINHFEYHSAAAKFWGGTPSIAPYIAAANSIRLINEIGVSEIQAHNRKLCQLLRSNLPNRYIASPLDERKKGGTVVINVPDKSNAEMALKDLNVHFDSRQYGIRLSPHIYNTTDEVEQLMGCFN